MRNRSVLIDAREFRQNRKTGIGRFLEGLLLGISRRLPRLKISLALRNHSDLPAWMNGHKNFERRIVPKDFIRSEKALSRLSHTGFDLLVSPYPKLPMFGSGCPSIHTIHDVFDLTGPFCVGPLRRFFDCWRLKSALRNAALTWYVSAATMQETQRLLGTVGACPKVRPNGVDDRFEESVHADDPAIRAMYGLDAGYVLNISNGKAHKNLAVPMGLADKIQRLIVLGGVPKLRQRYWTDGRASANIRWFDHISDQHLPAIIRGAFCFWLPSMAEGYGYPPLEAMACGVPTIVSDIAVLRETTGGNALFADPRSPQSWLDAMAALENDQFHRSQSKQGLNWAERFKGLQAWDKHIADIENLAFEKNG